MWHLAGIYVFFQDDSAPNIPWPADGLTELKKMQYLHVLLTIQFWLIAIIVAVLKLITYIAGI